MRTVLAVSASLLLASCARDGDAYVCRDAEGGQRLEAVAQVSLVGGKLKGFEVTDRNGLEFVIDETNSAEYICRSKAEIEATRVAAKEAVLAAEQAKKAADIRAVEEMAEAAAQPAKPGETDNLHGDEFIEYILGDLEDYAP